MVSFKRELYVLKNKVYMYLIQNIQLQMFFKSVCLKNFCCTLVYDYDYCVTSTFVMLHLSKYFKQMCYGRQKFNMKL